MIKKVRLLLLPLMGILVAACGDEAVDIEAVNKQTVLVYMPWSGDATSKGLYNAFLENLDSIESGIMKKGGLDKSRVLVFISESATSSKLYEILYEKKGCTRKELKEYSGNIYTTAEGIANIISDAKQQAEALNYALIVGCHGTGWTYCNAWTDYPNNAKNRKPVSSNDNTTLRVKHNEAGSPYEQTRFFGSVSDSNYATDIETLAEGIRLSNTRLQFLLFDDCYMANAEVAYELRECTNFLIASTSEVMAIGMPYAEMWASLNSSTPSYQAAVSAFYEFYSNYRVPCGTIAAIDCRQMDALAEVMKQINDHYSFPDQLFENLQILDGFNQPIFFDIGDYAEKLCTDPYLYERFAAQLAKTVVSKAATSSIYSYLYIRPLYITVETFSGLTISDPSQNPVAERGKTRTAWWEATH